MPEHIKKGLDKIAQAIQPELNKLDRGWLNWFEKTGLSKNIIYKIVQREPKFVGKGYEIASLLDLLDRLNLDFEIKPKKD